MKNYQVFTFLILLSLGQHSFSQHVFSEKTFEYRNTFLPYDVPYLIPLEDKHFIMLREERKNIMILGRYDQYFFEQWEKKVEFDKAESVPQLFAKGDSVFTYSFTVFEKSASLDVNFRIFNLESGEEMAPIKYSFSISGNDAHRAGILFSEDHSKFVIQYVSDQSGILEFLIFELGEREPFKICSLYEDLFSGAQMQRIHLSNNGDLLLALIDQGDFKSQVFFWNAGAQDHSRVESNFFLERPADRIENIRIIRQSTGSYFIAFSASIEDELIGFSILGVNVILKTVLVTYNQSFTGNEIEQLYDNYLVTSEKQKKRRLNTPDLLNDFRFVQSMKTADDNIILFFEELEMPVGFHDLSTSLNKPWKHKSDEDKFYYGGDLLMYCFDGTGQLRWKKTIQKNQFSQANSLGLSFISRILDNHLELLMYDSSNGDDFYVLSLNTTDGELIKKMNLTPDKRYEFVKRYSCWLSQNSLIILGVAPNNIRKRTLMLVEF